MAADPLKRYVFTDPARQEMRRRGLAEELVRFVLANPGQRLAVGSGREVIQTRVSFGSKLYLVRVFADVDRRPAEIVTAYRTSQIAKYWREEL